MDIKWLEDFLTLAQTRNFSQASQERNVSQPAFSRRIRALESWLGVSLFDRHSYPVVLTEEGRTFRDTAETVLATLYSDRAQFQEHLTRGRPDLRIAAATTLNLHFVPAWLRQLEPLTGHLTTHLLTRNFHDMAQNLADGEIDLVLQYSHAKVPFLFELSRFQTRILAHEDMVLVSTADAGGRPLHDPSRPLPGGQDVLPYVGYSGDGYFAEVEKLFFANFLRDGVIVRRLGESPTSEVLKRMALVYGATTLLPESCARDALDSGAMVIVGDQDWRMQLEVRLYRARDSRRTGVRKIWAALEATAETEPRQQETTG
ncbi:LysR family transcriptional regulator [Paracoccus sp. (in: a-proteobacteria)]|uniref:LysR family transcriptional regulator n=1 Tax=Paracoccus sp. TaxID=267 RepID=UPI003A83FE1F